MKKVFLTAAAIVFLISGCSSAKTPDGSDITESLGVDISGTESSGTERPSAQPAEITVLKWGVDNFSHDEDECIVDLNEQLAADGSNIRVELVELDTGYDTEMTFAKMILDYEKENGSFDIVTYGSDWVYKIGAVNELIESGYFRELTAEEKAYFSDVPEICWNAAKVNGKHYTVPGINFGLSPDNTLHFHFNTKYIPEDKIKNFGGTFEELEELLDGAAFGERTTHLEYQTDYLDFTMYTPATVKGGLYLSDKTMTASNPYETEEVIEYARTLNRLYKAGHMNYRINFSKLELQSEGIMTDFAISVCGGKMDEDTLNKRLGKDHNVVVYTKPYYMENRLLGSTGIPVNSPHPDEAMELLKRLHSDKELSGLLTEWERNAIGLPHDNKTVDTENVRLSPFAEFELKYTDIDEFKDVSTLCQDSFDRLCKAENFDETLAEIVASLKAAGIDDYVALVNQRLEEYRESSDQ